MWLSCGSRCSLGRWRGLETGVWTRLFWLDELVVIRRERRACSLIRAEVVFRTERWLGGEKMRWESQGNASAVSRSLPRSDSWVEDG
jgi:hypothetical protein